MQGGYLGQVTDPKHLFSFPSQIETLHVIWFQLATVLEKNKLKLITWFGENRCPPPPWIFSFSTAATFKTRSRSPKKIFKSFFMIWAWRPSYLIDCDYLYKFSIPEGSTWNLKKIGPVVSEEKLFKAVDDRRTMDDRRQVITIAHPELLLMWA